MHGSNWKLSDIEVDVRGFPSVPSVNASSNDNNLTTSLTGGGRPGYPCAPVGGRGSVAGGGYETDDSVFSKDRRSSSPSGAGSKGGGGVFYQTYIVHWAVG